MWMKRWIWCAHHKQWKWSEYRWHIVIVKLMSLCLWDKGFTEGVGQHPEVETKSHIWSVQVGIRSPCRRLKRRGGPMRTSSGILACHSPRVVAKSRSEMTRLGIWKLVPNPNSRTERIGKTSYAGVKWRHRNPSPRFSRIKQTILFHWKSYIYVFITNRGEGLISKIILFCTIYEYELLIWFWRKNGGAPWFFPKYLKNCYFCVIWTQMQLSKGSPKWFMMVTPKVPSIAHF